MPADKELYKDKIEVSLDGRQIFYLFFGGAVIASLVFVLGVMVGKRVEARSHAEQQASSAVTRDPLAALDQLGDGKQRLVFPSALSGDKTAQRPLGGVDEAWAQRHQKAAAAKLAKAAELEVEPGQPAAAMAEPSPAAGKVEQPAAGKKEAPKKGAKAKEAKKLPKYTLQLSSFQERSEADAFFQKLTDAGYTPYIVEASVKGKGTWYRVRLGSFLEYEEAVRAKKNFEAGQNMIAYVTRLKRKK